jgi:hypothetical protein
MATARYAGTRSPLRASSVTSLSPGFETSLLRGVISAAPPDLTSLLRLAISFGNYANSGIVDAS